MSDVPIILLFLSDVPIILLDASMQPLLEQAMNRSEARKQIEMKMLGKAEGDELRADAA